MFDPILVTTDGSVLGNLALPIAADLARKYDNSYGFRIISYMLRLHLRRE